MQNDYFRDTISDSKFFQLLKTERDNIAHGNDSWAIHPYKPMGLIRRSIQENGGTWADLVFDKNWPFEPFKGEDVVTVMEDCCQQVGKWLDEIDILHDKAWHEAAFPAKAGVSGFISPKTDL